jgi:type I restriction enzyme R subunit
MVGREVKARETIDEQLKLAGWHVCDVKDLNLSAHRGIAVREFPLPGHGFADYLLYIEGKAVGVVEAKKVGATLIGVEIQSDKYTKGLPDSLPAWERPLPFAYESTGVETRFTNGLDPAPRSRRVFSFYKPEGLAKLLQMAEPELAAEAHPDYVDRGRTFLARIQNMPPLKDELWPPKPKAIANLEQSLRENRPRALVQMATGSGKTLLAIVQAYRLLKFAGARRILFLVDRGNLADQTYKEFTQYTSPYNNYTFTEEFIVQRLQSNTLDPTARVCICTIQRLYAMLSNTDLGDDIDESTVSGLESVFKNRPPIEYNPRIPIETFDVIITDECHRSIYNLWAQVLEYFDAYLIGLTATPSKQTFGFFNQNLVMEYGHEQAVADGVNVNYDVFRIRTKISDQGSTIEAGFEVEKQDRETREKRWEKLDDNFQYDPNKLDRDVVAPDQIRKIVQTFKNSLPVIYPGREHVPKTLIFAKDDNHAENIVEEIRQQFAKGNDFAQKITYRTTGDTPKNLIKAFRNSYNPRIAVTVDMIATGTDIKPVEIVFFMRAVKSRAFFEQMKGRGVRVIKSSDLKAVTPDAEAKDHFVIVDAVGVCEQDMTDSKPMEKKPTVSFEKLLQAVSLGNTEDDVLSSIAGRLARMEHRATKEDEQRIRAQTKGLGLKELSKNLVAALSVDLAPDARQQSIRSAVEPFHDPKLRELLDIIRQKNEITIDAISQDEVLDASFSADATDRAQNLVKTFEQFIEEHKDEITALQILYSRPYKERLNFEHLKELSESINAPPYLMNRGQLWQAYAALEKSKVKGAGGKRLLTDLVSLVRFAMHEDNELVPYPEKVATNFKAWLAGTALTTSQRTTVGAVNGRDKPFTEEQLRWLYMIRDHIAANLSIDFDDFDYAPFSGEGGLGKVHQLFGEQLPAILNELNEKLAA